MDEANFYWAMLVALVSAGWVVTAFFRDRIAQSIALSSGLLTRLIELDRLSLENPDILKFISQNAAREEAYFRSEQILEEDIFYKAKTLAYNQLNLFDELLSISSNTSGRWFFLKPATLVEKADWEEYIKVKLRHPFFRSILNNEAHIFGASLREFWDSNKIAIGSTPADPFIW